ncbi:MAG: HPr family phosphocarrier protein [Lentisphaerae bacterium]|jgi:phosphotransferase system HPr (HPr) family protein|nr:HPr family phosphocarrier protein [Lentisphaerota bacterium]
MKTYNLTIGAPHGLHSRTAAKIVDLVRSHNAKVRLFNRHNESADGDSIISVRHGKSKRENNLITQGNRSA